MRDTERRPWSLGDIGIRLFILSLAALLLMALQLTGRLKPVQSAITQLTSPAQLGVTDITDSISNAVNFVFELRTLRQRNAELEQINAGLIVDNFGLREVEHENEVLREMFDFAQTRPGLDLRGAQIVARVIGQDSSNFLDFMMLDLGQRHGIEVGMPVVTDQGLVGRISDVTDTTSKVLLITDASSSVNVILQSSRLNGVIRGSSAGDPVMDFIPQGAIFSLGEVVLTSGLGGRFPKGIPIGQVIEIRQRDIDVFQQAVIRPTVDFNRLELVMVVTNFDPLEIVPELLEQEVLPPPEVDDAGAPDSGEAATGEAATGEAATGEAATDQAGSEVESATPTDETGEGQ